MLIKVFSLTFDSILGGFNDAGLRDFLKDKEVLSIRDHFFIKNDVPYLAMVVKYLPVRQEIDPVMAPQGKRDESWRELISDADTGLFNLLREWRSKRSRQEGVPPYILFTNKQLAQIIKEAPTSLGGLEKIEGVGKAKIEKYGNEVLEITLGHKAKDISGPAQEGEPNDA